jgi:hypothetical protein
MMIGNLLLAAGPAKHGLGLFSLAMTKPKISMQYKNH